MFGICLECNGGKFYLDTFLLALGTIFIQPVLSTRYCRTGVLSAICCIVLMISLLLVYLLLQNMLITSLLHSHIVKSYMHL